MYIDVHCHLETCKNIEKAVLNAEKRNVKIVANGIDIETNRKVLEFVEKYKTFAALGLHPENISSLTNSQIKDEIGFIKQNRNKIISIGELGLDFKEGKKNYKKQKYTFENLVSLAVELNIPIIVHSRKAEPECIKIMEDLKAKKVVMHHFSGKMKLVERIVRNGWMLSIPSSVRYSEHFQKIIQKISIENLLCETDTPFMHPDKKFPNEPANVIASYEKIAEIKKLNLKEVEKKIEENFKRIFED